MNTPEAFTQQLEAYRAEIDAMDDQLIALLKQRASVVQKVGVLKQEYLAARCFIRPAREAKMVKRLAKAFEQHPFSSAAAASIWRILIAASTCMEQPLRISSFFQPDRQEPYWLAREYFGMFCQLQKEASPARVIGQLMDESALVGILPALPAGTQELWWKLLHDADAKQRPAIFACLPYAMMPPANHGTEQAQAEPAPLALAVGFVDVEPSGEDVTYLVIEGKQELSQSRMHGIFAAAGEKARWLQVAPANDPKHRLHLVEVDGFHTQENAALLQIREQCQEHLHRITILGAHAKPFVVAD